MCRLYGFHASAPTKVECPLVHAQNALMVQSRRDWEGKDHAHGWGVATYAGHTPHVERQAWAAYHGEHFRRAAERIHSRTVLAHVRRATIGPVGLENTHPFAEGRWTFIHNGTVEGFDRIRQNMLGMMSFRHRAAIAGATDSEHVFRLLLTLHDEESHRPIVETLRLGVRRVIDWCAEAAPGVEVGLNFILTDGDTLVGTRWGRGLYTLTRDGILPCAICGFPHVHHQSERPYRSVEVASEPLTDEPWQEMPDRSIYAVTPEVELTIEPL